MSFKSHWINLGRAGIIGMFLLSFLLPAPVSAFIPDQSQEANILTALKGLLTQLNHLLSPPTTEAQTAAPVCDMGAPTTAQPDTLFQIGWGALNATHVAYLATGNPFYNASDAASPTTGDLSYAVIGTTTTKMKATSGSGTINLCFDSFSTTGTYSECLARTPHVVCSRTVSIISPSDSQAPSVPIGLSASVISSSHIALSWSASSDNIAVTGYRIYRNGDEIFNSDSTSYQMTGLFAATSYSFTVAAYDAAGNFSAQSSVVTASTLSTAAYQTPASYAYQTPAAYTTPTFIPPSTLPTTTTTPTPTTVPVKTPTVAVPVAPAVSLSSDVLTRIQPIQDRLLTLSQRIAADKALVNASTYLAELEVISAEINLLKVNLNTTSASSFRFSKDLAPGVTDLEVRWLHETLKSLGYYSGPVTNSFTEATEEAVKSFQKAHKIPQEGVVGNLTRYELNLLYR